MSPAARTAAGTSNRNTEGFGTPESQCQRGLVSVDRQSLSDHLNLNYKTGVGSDFETMTRIASIDLAEGIVPENASVIVDIDVYTRGDFRSTEVNDVQRWIIDAHAHEKVAFFKVLGKVNTERLREK